jgi:potassium/hydrogen antiporter
LAGIDKANMIFNIVFFISVTSVLVQGTTLSIFAKWLNVALPETAKKITEVDRLILDLPKSSLREFGIVPDSFAVGKRIIDLSFPTSAFIIMIKRNGSYIRPGGSTQIEANDILMVLADSQNDFVKVNDSLYKSSEVVQS